MDNFETIKSNKNNNHTDILKYFEESYNKYTSSEHCISSKSITDSIKLYYINQLTNNIDKFNNKSFETIFNNVYNTISNPIELDGETVALTTQGGDCGIGVLGCYDITISLIRSVPSCKLPNYIFLISDKSKGPWNFITQILKLNPIKINQTWCGEYKNIYKIEKKDIINSICSINPNIPWADKLYDMDCDNIESLMCLCWKTTPKDNYQEDYQEDNNYSDDIQIKCRVCDKKFLFTVNDQKFFKDQQFCQPKTCKTCSKNRKKN
jgi:hypothetical protein